MHNGYCAKWKCKGGSLKCVTSDGSEATGCQDTWAKPICNSISEQYYCAGTYTSHNTTLMKYIGKQVSQDKVFCGHLANKYDPEAGKRLPDNCCSGDKTNPKCLISQGHLYNAQYIFEDPTSGGYFKYTSCGA